MGDDKLSGLCSNLENKLKLLTNLINKPHVLKMHNNLASAKISFNTLLKGALDSSILDYSSFAPSFLEIVLSLEGGINRILESFKADIMQGKPEACYTLAKTYEIGFYNQPKDEYTADLCILVAHKLKNRECTKIVQSNTAKYEIFEDIANKFINNYIKNNEHASFDEAILLVHLPCENINQSSIMLMGSNFSEG